MDCAGFERGLARLMGEPPGEEQRLLTLAGLREHAARCPECGGCLDLLELLGRPPGERDLVEPPDERYWADFGRRLGRRLEQEPLPSASRATRRAPWLGSVAAALLLAALGVWWIRDGRGPRAPEPGRGTPPAIAPVTEPAGEAATGLEERLEAEPPESLGAEVEGFAVLDAWGFGEEPEGLFPDVGDLDPQARDELLQWLRDQSS